MSLERQVESDEGECSLSVVLSFPIYPMGITSAPPEGLPGDEITAHKGNQVLSRASSGKQEATGCWCAGCQHEAEWLSRQSVALGNEPGLNLSSATFYLGNLSKSPPLFESRLIIWSIKQSCWGLTRRPREMCSFLRNMNLSLPLLPAPVQS